MSDYSFLPVFRDLIITGGAAEIARIGDAIEAQLHGGWLRDRAREEESGLIEGCRNLEWLVFNRTPHLTSPQPVSS